MTERTSVYLSQLSPAERKLLQLSIHINAMLVANADGNYSMRETVALAEAVRKLISEEEYRPLLLVAGSEPISDAAVRVFLEEHSTDVEGYLQQVAQLLKVLPEDAAEAYRKFTLYSIVAVAEASRDGLFGLMGDRISHSEKKVMKRMVELLELPVDDSNRAKLGVG
ncbi:MAG: hypothetical protein HY898_19530 [Deltaproteobacteria bacterium]|nr:hypothetical protein [Deltaproteobacteria bacterium]